MADDYDKFLNSDARRAIAWQALIDTRNPEYVSVRYNYPLEAMQAALEKIPKDPPAREVLEQRRRNPAARTANGPTRASELFQKTSLGAGLAPTKTDE